VKRLRIAGHPIHPVTTIFPTSLLTTCLVFSVLALVTRSPEDLETAHWLAGAVLVSGSSSWLLGLLDWLAIPSRAPSKLPGLRHALMSSLSLAFVGAAWALGRAGSVTPGVLLVLVMLAAAAMFTSYLLGAAINAKREAI
jgi:uncharacterized membrane protein